MAPPFKITFLDTFDYYLANILDIFSMGNLGGSSTSLVKISIILVITSIKAGNYQHDAGSYQLVQNFALLRINVRRYWHSMKNQEACDKGNSVKFSWKTGRFVNTLGFILVLMNFKTWNRKFSSNALVITSMQGFQFTFQRGGGPLKHHDNRIE